MGLGDWQVMSRHAVRRNTEPQNMQTQKATAYLVENILLLCGVRRYTERVEGERGGVIYIVAGVGAKGRVQ